MRGREEMGERMRGSERESEREEGERVGEGYYSLGGACVLLNSNSSYVF